MVSRFSGRVRETTTRALRPAGSATDRGTLQSACVDQISLVPGTATVPAVNPRPRSQSAMCTAKSARLCEYSQVPIDWVDDPTAVCIDAGDVVFGFFTRIASPGELRSDARQDPVIRGAIGEVGECLASVRVIKVGRRSNAQLQQQTEARLHGDGAG